MLSYVIMYERMCVCVCVWVCVCVHMQIRAPANRTRATWPHARAGGSRACSQGELRHPQPSSRAKVSGHTLDTHSHTHQKLSSSGRKREFWFPTCSWVPSYRERAHTHIQINTHTHTHIHTHAHPHSLQAIDERHDGQPAAAHTHAYSLQLEAVRPSSLLSKSFSHTRAHTHTHTHTHTPHTHTHTHTHRRGIRLGRVP